MRILYLIDLGGNLKLILSFFSKIYRMMMNLRNWIIMRYLVGIHKPMIKVKFISRFHTFIMNVVKHIMFSCNI